MKKYLIITLLVSLLAIVGCSTTKEVNRVATDTQIDLSGRWNDTDSRLVSEDIVKKMLTGNWLQNYIMENGKKPFVTVGDIKNKTSEHIETKTFVKDIQKEIINSGKISFVASKKERQEIREERLEQQSFASEETAKQLAEEIGADFILQGSISSIEDTYDNQKVVFYTVDLQLVNTETNEIVWNDDAEQKKQVTKKKYKF